MRRAAPRPADAVLHNAAKAGAWGSFDSYFKTNVVGTRNVIAAAGPTASAAWCIPQRRA
jgi:nucleoside-diphosphate-sugar epimerase